jgi:hypothetical protein
MSFRLLPNFVVVSPEGVVPDQELPEDVSAAVDLLMAVNRCGGHYMVSDGTCTTRVRHSSSKRYARDAL